MITAQRQTELLLLAITEIERAAQGLRELSRLSKTRAQELEKSVMTLNAMLSKEIADAQEPQ